MFLFVLPGIFINETLMEVRLPEWKLIGFAK